MATHIGKQGDLAWYDSIRGPVKVKVTSVSGGQVFFVDESGNKDYAGPTYLVPRKKGEKAPKESWWHGTRNRLTYEWRSDAEIWMREEWAETVKKAKGSKKAFKQVATQGPRFVMSGYDQVNIHFWSGHIGRGDPFASSPSWLAFGGRPDSFRSFKRLLDAANYLVALEIADAVDRNDAKWGKKVQSIASDGALVMADRILSGRL